MHDLDLQPICNVHKEKTGEEIPAVGVAGSPFGPVSLAYCSECLDAKRDSYNFMVAGLMGMNLQKKEDIRKDLWSYVDATLEYFEHSFEDLVGAVRKAEEDYNAYMLGEPN